LQLRRAAIFVFYDEDGISDDYIDYYLNDLTRHVDRLLVVSNSELTRDAETLFRKYTDEIYLRDNVGFDTWAYKVGLQKIGWDHLAEYDEVILANDTVFGPIYPFGEMFEVMSGRGLDFWGITKHGDDYHGDFTSANPYYYIPAHVQSYFTVYGKRLLCSDDLKSYWENLPKVSTFEEAVGKHETYFTKHFAEKGFTWDAYADVTDESNQDTNQLYYQPKLLMEQCRLPVVKCKLFNTDLLFQTAGEQAAEALAFIREHTDYDEDFIWRKILRKFHQYDIVKSLALTYVLPETAKLPSEVQSSKSKVALIMHLYYPSMFSEAFHYAQSMPPGTSVFLSTDSAEKADGLKALFGDSAYNVDIRIVENRGRSESALLIGMRDVISEYDLICFWKEKKSDHIDPRNAAVSWSHKISQNLLASQTYVENVISVFNGNPRLGLLSPMPPNHSVLFPISGREWEEDYAYTAILAERLELRVPLSEDKPPVCPLGGSFWFRADALKKLFEYDWAYEDFPGEPLPIEGTILHAIERIYPYVAQDAGYYPAYLLSDSYASLEFTNLSHYLRSFNVVAKNAGIRHGYYGSSFYAVDTGSTFASVTIWYLKKILPRMLYLALIASKRLIAGPDRKGCISDIKRHIRKRKAKRRNAELGVKDEHSR
jgi:rhamnosyltransferase